MENDIACALYVNRSDVYYLRNKHFRFAYGNRLLYETLTDVNKRGGRDERNTVDEK